DPAPRLLDECALRKMPVDAFERRNPIVLHARLSAELARERFGVTDPAVLSAIAKHTVGAGSMSALDCILYLADGLEPGRNFPQRAQLARLAERDLAAAMRATLLSTMQHLKERGIPASPETMAAAAAFALPTGDLEVRTA
ncbi:MAG: bis(5'-nucleosyl)-tetraphosphatase (symmetrical) YqeK, partial [Firmicutes bacterium]|nr:bis(5'-nucleosyl)-tetraphosphatase (symmetrical) YqeK [Bacillota bacterium]